MKVFISLILFFNTFLAASSGQAAKNSSVLNKIELNTCHHSKDECLLITSDRAESGSLSSNLALNNIHVSLMKKSKKLIKSYHSSFGFYDLENNRIILSELIKHTYLKETIINLNSLTISQTEMK